MADVQLKDGHIRIANRLFRAAFLAKLSPVESRCLMECLWRQYGWAIPTKAPEPFKVGGSALAQAVGGSRSTASQALTTLVDAGVLAPTGEADDRGRRFFLVQKDYERWTCGFHRNPGRTHWTPRIGDVSPFQNASVLIPERERPDTGTPTTTQTRAVVESPGALEPRENQVENQAPLLLTPVKADPVLTVWAGYTACRENQRKAPGKTARTVIKARLKDGRSVEALIAVAEWVMLSPDGWAPLLRESQSTGYETIYKPTKMDGRIDQAMAWRSNGSVKAPAGQVPGLTDEQRIAAQRKYAWQRDELVARMEAAPDIAAIPEITLPRLDSLLGTLVRAEPVPEWLRVKWVVGMDRRRVELQERLR